MSLVTTSIHFIKNDEPVIYMSNAMLTKFKLSTKDTVKLKLGHADMRVKIRRVKKKGMHLYASSSVQNHLKIPKKGKCFVKKVSDKEIRIGPLIGVLCAYKGSENRPFGAKTTSMKKYLLHGQGKAYMFAFTPKDIHWQQETIDAHFWSPVQGWMKKNVPFPDVIYNRITNRSIENSPLTEAMKERFDQRNIPIFNWSFFDKWQVYHMLKNDKEASAHVPETDINPSHEQIKTMLEKYKFIYLKPTSGYMGIGIYRLTYHPKRGYFMRYRKNGKNVLLRFSKFESIIKQLSRKRGTQLKNYIVQQGIRLIELDQCQIDFRFHLNKDKNNNWVVAGVCAKKSGRGSVTTHVRSGGKLINPNYALSAVFGKSEADRLLQKAKKITIQLAEAIQQNYNRTIGELGFDIGIDKKGSIWMFEANAKPGRSIFKHPSLKEQSKRSYRLIIEYCLYLSKFRKTGGEDS